MASNFDMSGVVDTLVSSAPQTIGVFNAMTLPVSNETQVLVSRSISYVAYTILVDVFDVAAVQGFQFNAVSLSLKQIQKKLEELTKKVDKLLKADMETAKNRIYHAMNYPREGRNSSDGLRGVQRGFVSGRKRLSEGRGIQE